jgi:hypothetical protein
MFLFFWRYRTPAPAKVALAYYSGFWGGSFLFGLLAVGRSAQLSLRRSYEARLGALPDADDTGRGFWAAFLVIVLATCWMVWTEMPIQATVFVSRSSLDRLADEALADPENAHLLAGRWAGLYRIDGVEVIGETVVLYIGKDRGSYGLARVPGAPGHRIFNIRHSADMPGYYADFPEDDGRRFPRGERIAGGWFVMFDAYWKVKVGWS